MEKNNHIPVNLSTLKTVKNSVIGNPSAKLARARDEVFVDMLVECLNHPPASEGHEYQVGIRIEAAHVISSLSYGSQEALRSLLKAQALKAFLLAISRFRPSDPVALRSAFARGLRALAAAIADTVGPSQWGLHSDSSEIRSNAEDALEYLFQLESLDTYLPLLVDTSLQTSTSIAQLLGSAIRTPEHSRAVADWLPPVDRMKEVKGKRGWEKPDAMNANSPSRHGGWAARNLAALLRSRDSKLQEAALLALAALAKDNIDVAAALEKSSPDRDVPSPLSSVFLLCKSRSLEVQLAACLCATRVVRSITSTHSPSVDALLGTGPARLLPVLHVVNRLIASSFYTRSNRTKACFILYHLATDNNDFCRMAVERGSAGILVALVKAITPTVTHTEMDDDEPESLSRLREAALTAVATLSLSDDETRREFTDLIPVLNMSLTHPHVGVRYAACQCIRALSRAVAVIRTSIVDSGVGMAVFQVFKTREEHRSVTYAALSAVCNLVNEFSPLRSIYLAQGLMPRLLELMTSGDVNFKRSSLWAVKNLLCKTSLETRKQIMEHLTWHELAQLLIDADERVQEQAWSIIRNLAVDEGGVALVFQELGTNTLLSQLTVALGSKDEDVLVQTTQALANLANGDDSHQTSILSHPQMLASLCSCLADARMEIHRPALSCVLELTRTTKRKELVDAGIASTLRRICEWTGGMGLGHLPLAEDEREVVEKARRALDWLEHGALDTGF